MQTDDTPPDFRTGTWILDDLADNMSIAGLIAIVLMVAGGVASGFRWRWGSGLAGGAGLAMAGLAAVAVGLAQFPIDSAHAFARVPSDDPFVLTITRDLGYWLLVAAGALGVVLFFASINDAFGDRRPGLNPWLAALGAHVDYSDPHIPRTIPTRKHDLQRESVVLDADSIRSYDAILIATDHDDIDYALLSAHARLVVDTRNAIDKRGFATPSTFKA